MKRLLAALPFLLAACGSDGSPSSPTATLFVVGGIVKDARTLVAVDGVRVEIIAGAGVGSAAMTTTSGDFTLSLPTSGSLTMRVSKEGYRPSERTVTVASSTSVEILLAPSAAEEHVVVVRATNADTGAALTNISVTVLDGARAGQAESSLSDQVPMQLATGAVTLRVIVQGFQPVDQRLEVAGGTVVTVRLSMSRLAVTGRVVDISTGETVTGARVEVVGGVNAGRLATTDAGGSFTLNDVAQGALTLRTDRAGYVAAIRNFTLGTTDLAVGTITVERQRLNLSGTIAFSGNTITSSLARVEILDGPNRGKAVTADASGRYQLAGVFWGSFTVRVSSDCLVASESLVTIADNSPSLNGALTQDLQATRKGFTLSGTVTEFPRTGPSVGTDVMLRTGGDTLASRPVDAAGRYSFSNVCGDFTMTIQKHDFSTWSTPTRVVADMTRDAQLPELTFTLTLESGNLYMPDVRAQIVSGPYAGQYDNTHRPSDADNVRNYARLYFRGLATIRISKTGYVTQLIDVDLQSNRTLRFNLVRTQ